MKNTVYLYISEILIPFLRHSVQIFVKECYSVSYENCLIKGGGGKRAVGERVKGTMSRDFLLQVFSS
jgi:hypothetical protein